MKYQTLTDPLTIHGIELRTSNDVAFETVPPFWGWFYAQGAIDQVPDRVSDDVYAVYTNFEHEGVDNHGTYSLVIGCLVAPNTVPNQGFRPVTIPASERAVFEVTAGRPDLVGAKWQEIWARTDLANTYLADFECYAPDGSIEISIGVHPDQ